jgi:hypothetical protein
MITTDPQAIGWEDERGSATGHVRVAPTHGKIIALPLQQTTAGYSSTYGGTATISANTSDIYQGVSGYLGGPLVQVPAGINNYALFEINFYGPVFGLQLARTTLSQSSDLNMCIWIDGELFPMEGTNKALTDLGYANTVDAAGFSVMVKDIPDLPKGRGHVAVVYFTAPTTGTATYQFTGYLVDENAGYSQPPRNSALASQLLTTTPAGLSHGGSAAGSGLGVKQIIFWNSDTVSHVVKMKQRLNNSGSTVDIWSATLAPANTDGCSVTLDFAGPIAAGSGLPTVYTDANSVVYVSTVASM